VLLGLRIFRSRVGLLVVRVCAERRSLRPTQLGMVVLRGLAMTYYQRNLPHWHPEGRAIFLTWRVWGSLPQVFLRDMEKLRSDPARQFLAVDQMLDAGLTGPHWLSDPTVADHVVATLVRGRELGRYRLQSYVVMSNHVHILIYPLVPLARITNGIKGVSAHEANAILKRKGKHFWQDESFDHWIRNDVQFERARKYIERNPVKAGLVTTPEEWRWSSAYKRAE
jgi:putative transposase